MNVVDRTSLTNNRLGDGYGFLGTLGFIGNVNWGNLRSIISELKERWMSKVWLAGVLAELGRSPESTENGQVRLTKIVRGRPTDDHW